MACQDFTCIFVFVTKCEMFKWRKHPELSRTMTIIHWLLSEIGILNDSGNGWDSKHKSLICLSCFHFLHISRRNSSLHISGGDTGDGGDIGDWFGGINSAIYIWHFSNWILLLTIIIIWSIRKISTMTNACLTYFYSSHK